MSYLKVDKESFGTLSKDITGIKEDIDGILDSLILESSNNKVDLKSSLIKKIEYYTASVEKIVDGETRTEDVTKSRVVYDYTSQANVYNNCVAQIKEDATSIKKSFDSSIQKVIDALENVTKKIDEFESQVNFDLSDILGDEANYKFSDLKVLSVFSKSSSVSNAGAKKISSIVGSEWSEELNIDEEYVTVDIDALKKILIETDDESERELLAATATSYISCLEGVTGLSVFFLNEEKDDEDLGFTRSNRENWIDVYKKTHKIMGYNDSFMFGSASGIFAGAPDWLSNFSDSRSAESDVLEVTSTLGTEVGTEMLAEQVKDKVKEVNTENLSSSRKSFSKTNVQELQQTAPKTETQQTSQTQQSQPNNQSSNVGNQNSEVEIPKKEAVLKSQDKSVEKIQKVESKEKIEDKVDVEPDDKNNQESVNENNQEVTDENVEISKDSKVEEKKESNITRDEELPVNIENKIKDDMSNPSFIKDEESGGKIVAGAAVGAAGVGIGTAISNGNNGISSGISMSSNLPNIETSIPSTDASISVSNGALNSNSTYGPVYSGSESQDSEALNPSKTVVSTHANESSNVDDRKLGKGSNNNYGTSKTDEDDKKVKKTEIKPENNLVDATSSYITAEDEKIRKIATGITFGALLMSCALKAVKVLSWMSFVLVIIAIILLYSTYRYTHHKIIEKRRKQHLITLEKIDEEKTVILVKKDDEMSKVVEETNLVAENLENSSNDNIQAVDDKVEERAEENSDFGTGTGIQEEEKNDVIIEENLIIPPMKDNPNYEEFGSGHDFEDLPVKDDKQQ